MGSNKRGTWVFRLQQHEECSCLWIILVYAQLPTLIPVYISLEWINSSNNSIANKIIISKRGQPCVLSFEGAKLLDKFHEVNTLAKDFA